MTYCRSFIFLWVGPAHVPPTSSSLRQFVARQNNFLFFFFLRWVPPTSSSLRQFACYGWDPPTSSSLTRDKMSHDPRTTMRQIVTCDNSLLDVTFEQHCCHTATGCANQRTRRQHALFCGSRTRDL
jgi:hypothetical protein